MERLITLRLTERTCICCISLAYLRLDNTTDTKHHLNSSSTLKLIFLHSMEGRLKLTLHRCNALILLLICSSDLAATPRQPSYVWLPSAGLEGIF